MAVVYFVKDGPHPNSSGSGYEASVADLEAQLAGRELKYLGTQPPEINPTTPSQYPVHVVVEVEASEPLGSMFMKVGFFLIVGASPNEIGPLMFPGSNPALLFSHWNFRVVGSAPLPR